MTNSPEQSPTPSPGASGEGSFSVTLTLDSGYAFDVDSDLPGARGFRIDEEPPLGAGSAATPSRVLAAAMASCLASSLLFCLRKARVDVRALTVKASGELVRNERRRLRVGGIAVSLFPVVAPGDEARMARCLEIFEDFCIVTESVRHGIPVAVEVRGAAG